MSAQVSRRVVEEDTVDIVRNADGTLLVPVAAQRRPEPDLATDVSAPDGTDQSPDAGAEPTTRLLHPGEGGYDESLTAWDLQQNPDREPVVSTAAGRQEAMTVVHAVAEAPDDVDVAVEALADPDASGDALRHVLVGGVHSVEDFANEVSNAEGGEPLPAHTATKIIGQVLAELDT